MRRSHPPDHLSGDAWLVGDIWFASNRIRSNTAPLREFAPANKLLRGFLLPVWFLIHRPAVQPLGRNPHALEIQLQMAQIRESLQQPPQP